MIVKGERGGWVVHVGNGYDGYVAGWRRTFAAAVRLYEQETQRTKAPLGGTK